MNMSWKVHLSFVMSIATLLSISFVSSTDASSLPGTKATTSEVASVYGSCSIGTGLFSPACGLAHLLINGKGANLKPALQTGPYKTKTKNCACSGSYTTVTSTKCSPYP